MTEHNDFTNLSNRQHQKIDANQPMGYQFRIEGHLGAQWAEWFEGLTITWEANGDTLLTGSVADQAALYGILKKVRDLGMPLHSVMRTNHEQTD